MAITPRTKDRPAIGAFVVVPDDVTVFPAPTVGLWVGGSGVLVVTMLDGSTAPLRGVNGGQYHPLQVTQVLAATTCTDIVGLI